MAITSSSRTVLERLARPIKDTKPAATIKNMWISDHQNSIFLHGKFLINHIHSFHLQPKIIIDIKLVKRLKIHNRYSRIHGSCGQFWFYNSIVFSKHKKTIDLKNQNGSYVVCIQFPRNNPTYDQFVANRTNSKPPAPATLTSPSRFVNATPAMAEATMQQIKMHNLQKPILVCTTYVNSADIAMWHVSLQPIWI